MVVACANEVVAAWVDGRVVHVIAKSGERVHAGDPIAEFDPTLFADRLHSATATVDAARVAGNQRSATTTDEDIKTPENLADHTWARRLPLGTIFERFVFYAVHRRSRIP